MMKENGLYYEEFKKLMSVKNKKEYVNVIYERIEQEEVIEYKVNYCEVNHYEYENKKEVYCIESKPCLINSELIVCRVIEDQKVECCELIEDQKAEYCEFIECYEDVFCEVIEDKSVEYREIIEDQEAKFCEVIEDQKVELIEIEDRKDKVIKYNEDINMLKSSRNESDEIKKLNFSKKELKVIAREIGVKNYKNLSKIKLIREINKIKPSKGPKKSFFAR